MPLGPEAPRDFGVVRPRRRQGDPFRTFITSDVKQVYIKQVSSNSSWIKTNQTFTYGCTYCTAQKTDLDGDDDYHELIYALSTPYTVTMIPPEITMSFGTAEALSANDVTGTVCTAGW